MPPIDLGAKPEALAQMPVSIIVPVPRADWAETPTELVQQALTLAPAAPLGGQPKTPIALIRTLLEQEADWDLIDPTVSAEWLALLAGRTTLWYARRRQFLRTDALAGEAFRFQVNPPGTEPEEPEEPEEPPAPVPEPVEPPASAPDTAGPLVELWNESVARALVPWGLDRLYRAVRSQDNAAGRETRAALNAALLDALGADSPVAATHLLHLATGSRDPDPIEEFRALLRDAEAFRRFAPFEGLLTGGLIDFRVPNFPSRVAAPQSPPDLLTRANLNQRPRAAPGLQLPSAMPTRTSRLLTTLEIERGTLRSIVLHGGGQVPLRAPRNLEVLTEALKVALENEVPVIVRARDPGSVEAQTRRNLLAFTKRVPEMVKRLATDDLGRRLGDYIGHLEAMEEAMTSDFQGANRTVRRSVRRLLQGT